MNRARATAFLLPALCVALLLVGCKPAELTEAEKQTVASLSLSSLTPLPPDPSNSVADLPLAAAFGATLFFEQRLSGNGQVSCASCHKIDRQFQDDLPRAVGIGVTNRRTMPLAGVARSPFLFWDGRKDSLWSQALGPLENPLEHGGNRTAMAVFVAREFSARYARIFGALPDLSGVPANAGPEGTSAEKAAWTAMPEAQRVSIDRVFANLGKAIAAFERSIVHEKTRFDRFADAVAAGAAPQGAAALSDQEIYGLRLFTGRASCVNCHNGPRFTDDHFHNTGVPVVAGLPVDLGREPAVAQVLADPFNCLGVYSDAGPDACSELRFMKKANHEDVRAYKTPSLRGVADRSPYMHAGQFATLEEVVEHYVQAPASPDGHSEIVPLKLSDREREALVAFLNTLSD